MVRPSKRLQKLRQNPKNVSLHELQQVLEDFGFQIDRVSGSHYIFRAKIAGRVWRLTIPHHKPIKTIYVKQAIIAIDEIIQWQDEMDEEE